MTERNFAQTTPEEAHSRAMFAFELAMAASKATMGSRLQAEAAPLSINATLLGIQASLLDRLERIILLLDERLPVASADLLAGTIEDRGDS